MNSSYDFINCENEYLEKRACAFEAHNDNTKRHLAMRGYKEIYGSSIRKLMERSGWNQGQFLETRIIRDKFGRFSFPEEVYTFAICLLEAYNDNMEYKYRKVPIKRWRSHMARKKHLNAFFVEGKKELRIYSSIYKTENEKKEYYAMRKALIIYNTIFKTFFVKKLPMYISSELYDACVKVDKDFGLYYHKVEVDRAKLTRQGLACSAREKGGLRNTFSDDVTWIFILHILHLEVN